MLTIDKVREVLGVYLKGDKLDSASQAVMRALAVSKVVERRPEDKVIDGVQAKYCSMAKAWFPVEDFVKNKNYTKRGYNVWHKHYSAAKKMAERAANEFAAGLITQEVFMERMAASKVEDSRKDDISSYEEVRKSALEL